MTKYLENSDNLRKKKSVYIKAYGQYYYNEKKIDWK